MIIVSIMLYHRNDVRVNVLTVHREMHGGMGKIRFFTFEYAQMQHQAFTGFACRERSSQYGKILPCPHYSVPV